MRFLYAAIAALLAVGLVVLPFGGGHGAFNVWFLVRDLSWLGSGLTIIGLPLCLVPLLVTWDMLGTFWKFNAARALIACFASAIVISINLLANKFAMSLQAVTALLWIAYFVMIVVFCTKATPPTRAGNHRPAE